MRFIKLIVSIAFLSTLFIGCTNQDDEAKTIIEDNASFDELKALGNKNYSLTTTDGKKIDLKVENETLTSKQLAGKTVLVNFWATWCAPCLKEIPTFNHLYEKYKDKFEIVAVLYEHDKDPQELDAFIKKYNIKFPVLVGEENFRMAKAFDDVKRVPESFVYGKDGKFLEKFIGVVDENILEKYITK